jgi:hypothetical protein
MRKEKSVSNGVQSAPAPACGLTSIGKLCLSITADRCPVIGDEIATDRPDVTNPALLCLGSLQIENGINVSAREGDRFLDGTNTRFRAETRFSAARSTPECGMPIVNVFTSCQELIV